MARSPIVRFYLGQSSDLEGRRIEQIWDWDNSLLEEVHDYIQWLFPLLERSRFNSRAPVLTQADIETFRTNDELKNRLLISFKRMLQFYGLQCLEADGAISITMADSFPERRQDWLNWGDHNHLRITRILTSLRLLGLEPYAQAFFKCLTQIYQAEPDDIDPRSYTFWKEAVTPTTHHLPPTT
ncbi:hypothetical protein K9N68_00970 [Kovacikia minuta CCNUW1]|uniref:opioid growth factor receptor-related protein n=1 Tax=Kovacikia minuta TaxID=2931930 RepID=UPI001CC95872|nr:opioid growth factor receptor-related protein [Kovacikia minuta]UBF26617.1 hypothetical protein K9N68_00970 [Kovacikia minuta CCNUW1]